ncbi:MAG: V-type ATP synthase subunit E family protein [Candidatus Micrarchaeaceae archaeon]
MGLQDVLENIRKHSEESLSKIESDTAAQEKEILDSAKEEAKGILEAARGRAKKDAELIKAKEAARARIDGRMIYNNALGEKAESAIELLKESIGSYTKTSEYKSLLEVLVAKALANLGEGCTIFARREDMPYIKKIPGVHSLQAGEGFAGGIKAATADGKREVDYTIESIIDAMKDRLASRIIDFINLADKEKAEQKAER